MHKFLGHTTKTVTYSSCWLQLINDSTASDAISIKCFFFFRVLLHAGNSYGHFIYLIYVISWGTYSICRLPELIIHLDETKWKNCSCNVLLFGYSDDILNLTQDCVLDYVGKSFFFYSYWINCSSQNVMLSYLSITMINTGFVHYWEMNCQSRRWTSQGVLMTHRGCGECSWYVVSLLPSIGSKTFLVISCVQTL